MRQRDNKSRRDDRIHRQLWRAIVRNACLKNIRPRHLNCYCSVAPTSLWSIVVCLGRGSALRAYRLHIIFRSYGAIRFFEKPDTVFIIYI